MSATRSPKEEALANFSYYSTEVAELEEELQILDQSLAQLERVEAIERKPNKVLSVADKCYAARVSLHESRNILWFRWQAINDMKTQAAQRFVEAEEAEKRAALAWLRSRAQSPLAQLLNHGAEEAPASRTLSSRLQTGTASRQREPAPSAAASLRKLHMMGASSRQRSAATARTVSLVNRQMAQGQTSIRRTQQLGLSMLQRRR